MMDVSPRDTVCHPMASLTQPVLEGLVAALIL